MRKLLALGLIVGLSALMSAAQGAPPGKSAEPHLRFLRMENNAAVYAVGSGTYRS